MPALEALRTPDDRFADLPDFPYRPHYVDDLPGFEGLRAAYLDEGPRDAARTWLCLHGEPTWSFLYRRMIPVFLAAGGRVVAPDFLGFGRSDKPVADAAYTFGFHRDFLLRLVERLDLRGINLVVQDWGGLLGLTLPVDGGFRPRLAGLLAMNTTLATGEPLGEAFDAWRAYVARAPDMSPGALLRRGNPWLTDREVAAYDAPFPDARHKAGVRAFPTLVMTDPAMPGVAESRAAARFWAEAWDGPSLVAYGSADPIFTPAFMESFRRGIRGAPAALAIPEGGHFVQEVGAPIARAALAALA